MHLKISNYSSHGLSSRRMHNFSSNVDNVIPVHLLFVFMRFYVSIATQSSVSLLNNLRFKIFL